MRFFFASSAAFDRQLTALYDVVNPAAAAMWNLRWQVRGYMTEREEANEEELHGRFVTGSGVGSANLRRHCLEISWEDQSNELAVLALYAGISLYEGWTAALEVGNKLQREGLQFPSKGTTRHHKNGAGDTVSALRSTPSPSLEAIYGTQLRASKRYMPHRLEDLLLAYRCYKEARNSCAHAGRVASDWAEFAYQDAHAVATGLGARGSSLSLPSMQEGQPVKVTLSDIKGLWAIMFSLVKTIDAELAPTEVAEAAMRTRWQEKHSFRMLSGEQLRRRSQIRRLNTAAGFPNPDDADELYNFLRANSLLI